jgi:putative ABC transport system permease protein
MIIESLAIIMQQLCMHIPLALGAYISIALLKVPDLSLETAYVCGALFGAKMITALQGMPPTIILPAAMIAGCVGGALVGLTSSILTQKAQLPHLLSTIITAGIFHGLNQLIAASYISLSSYPNPLALLPGVAHQPELLTLMLIAGVIIGLCAFLLRTQLGYACAVYGNNPDFFKHYGVSTSFIFITGIVISNSLAGMGGYLFAQSNGFAELNVGVGKILLCLTALIIGKALIKSNRPITMRSALIGTAFYFVIQQLLLRVGFNLKYFTMVQSIIVLIILVTLFTKDQRNTRDNLGV